jgi:hypothetical protein
LIFIVKKYQAAISFAEKLQSRFCLSPEPVDTRGNAHYQSAMSVIQFFNSIIEAVLKRINGIVNLRKTRSILGLKKKIGWFVHVKIV